MKKQKLGKIFIFIFILVEAVFMNMPIASAAWFWPSPEEVARRIEKRYNLDLPSIQDMGQKFNVSDNKKNPPQVNIFFNPSDPKPGEKLTAEALPTYFSAEKEYLYYTWYLEHFGCSKDNSPGPDKIKKCDRDGDNKITVNDWKIEAMMTLTNSGYDTRRGDYSSDNDKDGFKARWGGSNRTDEQEQKTSYCYVHDFTDGKDYEMAGTNGSTATCPGGGTPVCVTDDQLSCSGSFGTPPAFLSKACGDCINTEENPACLRGANTATCSNGTPRCVSNTSLLSQQCNLSATTVDELCTSNTCSSLSTGTPQCSGGGGSFSNKCYDHLPHHLFPYYKNQNVTRSSTDFPGISSNQINLHNEEVGDGHFERLEEAFWYTNPNDPDTADNGNMDEANAVGVGQYLFSWTYQDGDKIGVAIEGPSMIPTKHDNSSMMLMWAFTKNDCPPNGKGSYSELIKNYNVPIPSFNPGDYQDFFDSCLEKNIVDPKEGQQPKKLEVALSYSPENPINDSSVNSSTGEKNNMGDKVIVQSALSNNNQSPGQLLYEWQVDISPDGAIHSMPSEWQTICKSTTNKNDPSACILDASTLKGLDVSALDFKLNITEDDLKKVDSNAHFSDYFPDGTGYLRVFLRVNENYPEQSKLIDRQSTREGRGEVVIKVSTTGQQIRVFEPAVNTTYLNEDPLTHGPLTLDQNNEYCNDPADIASIGNCLVAKNEIVALKIDNTSNNLKNFSWTLNGQPLVCSSSTVSFADCLPSEQTNTNFFPVTGEPGTKYSISVNANDVTTGKTVNLTRNFQVVDPYVKIISDDEAMAWKKYLGSYMDLDNNDFPDYSESLIETHTGNAVKLRADFHPSWLVNFSDFDWTLDGSADGFTRLVDANGKPLGISFTADKLSGDVYNASLTATYSQPQEIRKALSSIWNINQFESTEKIMTSALQIELSESDDVAILDHPGKFLAGLLSYLPSQIMFLLRMVLTIFTILLVTGIVFAFIPEPIDSKENQYEED
jgi:hypothetical protein